VIPEVSIQMVIVVVESISSEWTHVPTITDSKHAFLTSNRRVRFDLVNGMIDVQM
jgi:hypothetical protein